MPSNLRGFSESVYDALRSISVDRAVVIGHSFGGYLALQLMGDHPEVFEALILADTRAAADTPRLARSGFTRSNAFGFREVISRSMRSSEA